MSSATDNQLIFRHIVHDLWSTFRFMASWQTAPHQAIQMTAATLNRVHIA